MKRLYLAYLIFILAGVGCIPEKEEVYDGIEVDFSDPKYQHFYDLQVEQNIDSLLLYTSDPDPTIRYLLARTFASFQDEKALDSLVVLLGDAYPEVSTAAAYSIGQLKNEKSVTPLVQAFKTQDSTRIYNRLNANILEAIGKSGDTTMLNYIATADTYKANDTLLLTGQARAVYQYALRGITTEASVEKSVESFLDRTLPDAVRNIYGQSLTRLPEVDLSKYENRLYRQWDTEDNVNLKMTLARLADKFKTPELRDNFINDLNKPMDYRVKVDLIRRMKDYPYIKVVEKMITLLKDDNIHVAETAASYFTENGIANDATIYKNFIPEKANYRVKHKMYGSILKHLPAYYTRTKNSIKKELTEGFDEIENAYERASIIAALGNDAKNYKALLTYSGKSPSAVEKSTAASAIASILNRDDFDKIFGYSRNAVRNEIRDSIRSILSLHDSGVNAIYGEMIGNKDNGIAATFENDDAIKEALSAAKLPEEIETYNSLLKAQAAINNTEYTPKHIATARAVNWQVLSSYGDSIQAIIDTEKGNIKLKLFPKLAPQSVFNFIELANSNFYDNKVVHRVAPNFVIQDGCPRGDGYGSLDYTIRSEFPEIRYEQEGYIGMASAGAHTEGTQWFITHSPAMHLNGRYTIFGKVIDGMSTVHEIEVGDKINSIKILK